MVFRKAAEVLDNREAEGDGLARTGAGLSDDVAPGQDVVVRDGLQERSFHEEIEQTTQTTRKKQSNPNPNPNRAHYQSNTRKNTPQAPHIQHHQYNTGQGNR